MINWPAAQQKYTLLHRKGTKGFAPQGATEDGGFACVRAAYKRLPPLEEMGASADQFTDGFGYGGYKCAPPVKPGRGEGVGDVPGLKFAGDIDPSDIAQGGVGDCWLLSGISQRRTRPSAPRGAAAAHRPAQQPLGHTATRPPTRRSRGPPAC